MKIALLLLSLFILWFVPGQPSAADLTPLADIVSQMTPGVWYPVPDTKIPLYQRDEMSSNTWGYTGSRGVIDCWTGASFDPDSYRWFFHGGGHSDYGGNEVYQFDFRTMEWTRLTAPYNLPDPTGSVPCPVPPDGPGSAHNYDAILWVPKTQSIWYWPGNFYCRGGSIPSTDVWEFNPATKTWRAPHPRPSIITSTVNQYRLHTEIDPQTKNVILSTSGRTWVFNPLTEQYSLAGTRGAAWYGSMVLDLSRNLMVVNDYDGIYSFEYKSGATGLRTSISPNRAGGYGAGMVYCPRIQKMVLWGGTRAVWTCLATDPAVSGDQVQWEQFSNSSGPAPTVEQGNFGVFGKWIYIKALDVFAGYNNHTENVWLYRLPDSPSVEALLSGMDLAADLSIQAMPNPFSRNTVITIKGCIKAPVTVRIYNSQGRLVEARSSQTASVTWQPAHLKQGVYFIKAETGGHIIHKKIIALR